MTLLDCPPLPVTPSDAAASPDRVSPSVFEEKLRTRLDLDRRLDGWALPVFWLLAVAAVGLCTWNFHDITLHGVQQERLARASVPDGTPGKGHNAALAALAPLPMLDPDSFCWISIVQRQVQAGDLRNRRFDYDNAPSGRELHWSASFAWWMLIVAAPVHFANGLPWPEAVAVAAPWTNPILLVLALTALALATWRKSGVWTAGVLTVTLATLWGVEWDFCYGRPDHHGLHLIAFLGMLLCALGAGLGWVRVDGGHADGDHFLLTRPLAWKSARRAFGWSGFFGALGLWIGATQQMFVIGAVGAAAALGALFFVRPESPRETAVRFVPALWRDWARTGALASVGFYLLEYFPFHLSMRLEVNHPLYALAWWGGGELIHAAGEWACHRRGRWPDRAGWTRIGVGLLCLSALPLAVLAGPRSWYVVRDPVLLRIMQTVSEGRPFIPRWTWIAAAQAVVQGGVLWLAIPLGVGFLLRNHRQPDRLRPWRALGVWVALAPAVVCGVWLYFQSRWLGFESAALAVVAVVLVPAKLDLKARTRLPLGLLALTVPGWLLYALHETNLKPSETLANETLGATLAMEEVGWNLRLSPTRPGGHDATAPAVIAPLGMGTALHYYSGAVTVGSLYWENVEGCREQVRFLADDAPGEPTARRIARERGLDYVVVISDPQRVLQVQWIDRGTTDHAALPRTLAYRLSNPRHATPPDWLEPHPLIDAPLAAALGVRLYRVRRERL